MKELELGNVIATRSLTGIKNGKSYEIVVLIGEPRQMESHTDFFTPYKLQGVGRERVRYAAGIDAVQALQLVMKMIGAELEVLHNKPDSKIMWVGGRGGDLGFPVE